MIDVLKVSSKSNPNSVAGALAGVIRSNGSVEVQVVGAGALNQAVKAVAIARGYLATTGQDLMCRPTFADIRIEGESRTAIRLHVETCPAHPGAPTVPAPAVPAPTLPGPTLAGATGAGPTLAGGGGGGEVDGLAVDVLAVPPLDGPP